MVIEGFEHSPGKNCGSTSLWNISKFYGNRYPEHIIFGLSSGLLFFYMKGGFGGASYAIGGRNPLLVEDFFDNIGLSLKWQSYDDFPEDIIKESISSSIPVLARTDLFYLPYYKNPVHFPGHEIVIFGYEEKNDSEGKKEDVFIVSDSSFPEPQKISRQDLARAMSPENVIAFFSLHNHILPTPKFEVKLDKDSIVKSIHKVCQRMLRFDLDFMGIKGIKKFHEEIELWADAKDRAWVFRFAYQVIERRGTGGGSFRFMYSDFLQDSAEIFSGKDKTTLYELAADVFSSAELWRNLAFRFKEISEKDGISKDEILELKNIIEKIYSIEEKTFLNLEKFVSGF